MSEEKKHTPMMEQWQCCKQVAKEALLLFRMGDFYEAFYEDAEILSKEAELFLTKRQEIPMSGVPWHTVENYIDRLVSKGYKVAVAEQVEDPAITKGLVKREVVRIVTPGTFTGASLAEKSPQLIASISQVGSLFGLAFLDLTTAEFNLIEFEEEKELLSELLRLHPKECLITKKFKDKHAKSLLPFFLTLRDEWSFDHKMSYAFLTKHFKVQSLDGFGLKGKVAAINAAGALLTYIKDDLLLPIDHIQTITALTSKESLFIDAHAERHLELTESLLKLIDRTLTPMGGRLMASWLKKPLLSPLQINQRQDALETLMGTSFLLGKVRSVLKEIRDLERIMMKISSRLASPRDFLTLRLSLEQIGPLKALLEGSSSTLIEECSHRLFDMRDLTSLIKDALVDEPPLRTGEGGLFRDGYHAALDELRAISRDGKEWIARYQSQIRDEMGIKTLKVIYNKVFGYMIEVSKGQAHLLEEKFEKRQTLANCERFSSLSLKEYESKVLSAEERKNRLEEELFEELREKVKTRCEQIFTIAKAVAILDALASLADLARVHHYVRPQVDESHKIDIVAGRHPVVEEVISREYFISNDTSLDSHDKTMMVITGPNMAGKSTYIRQVALLVILAQMGSFIPAKSAHIGIVDKIFTRIGASDDLNRGQSTFMVEMSETANILNNATCRSLVILDEIGRGTSTYDGLSIAWAIAEYLLTTEKKRAKTLFATHYFELTALEESFPQAINYHAAVKELNEDIVFLHKIVKGKADRSYGIHVAKLSGLPLPLILRAQEILNGLEQRGGRRHKIECKKSQVAAKEEQLTML